MTAVDEAAPRLWTAAETATPCAPVRDVIAAGDTEAAYAVQQRNVERAVTERGWRVCGRKIGLTNPAVQAQLGVDRPDFGALFAELGHGDGEEVPFGTLLQPRIEAEVAFVLDDDLDLGTHTVADVDRRDRFLLPVLEIVDSRVAGWDITFVDTVADNASSGRFVLGTVPVEPRRRPGRRSRCACPQRRGTFDRSGAACLGNPLFAARWLADTMSRLGTPLVAGDIVLSGALGPMVPIGPGDRVEAGIEGVGRVGTRFRVVVKRRYVDVPFGQVHLAEAGDGRPSCCCTRRRVRATSSPRCCRSSVGIAGRSPSTSRGWASRCTPRWRLHRGLRRRRRRRGRRPGSGDVRSRRPPHGGRRRRGDRRRRLPIGYAAWCCPRPRCVDAAGAAARRGAAADRRRRRRATTVATSPLCGNGGGASTRQAGPTS